MRYVVVLIGSVFFSVTLFAQTAEFADVILGRWDVTVTGADGVSYPSWLEIRLRKENELMASFVGRAGSVRYATTASYVNGKLSIAIPQQYERAPKELVFNGALLNSSLEGAVEDENGKTISWTAVRAPELSATKPITWGPPQPLFNSKDLTGWRLRSNQRGDCWSVAAGAMTNRTPCADIISERKFTDFKLHVEFQTAPQCNSGVYLRGRYEVQIDDSAGRALDSLRMGGVYGFLRPVVNAAKKAGEWQALDITLIGRKVTVVLNGTTIIDNETIPGITGGALDSDEAAPGPIKLQGDHTRILYRKVDITLPR